MIDSQEQQAASDSVRDSASKTGKARILVINDTQEILDLFREILEEEGYEVVLSSFGVKELGDIRAIAPDLVILDFLFGNEPQGWQLLQKIRMTRDMQALPIIVCTAALRMARELEGHLEAKNVGLVLKPFDIDDLLDEVSRALRPGGLSNRPDME
ncbi:MAG TPA: response regulator [Thermomicrobiales bacterium]|nr:response regulator [Thermomicrobiales bacterium]